MNSTELKDFFQEGFFLKNISSETKSDVLKELVQPLVDRGKIKNARLVLEILNKRETLGSTGIGKGVAIPHCRTLVVSDIHIVVGISKKGIRYDAIDKKEVHLIFLIVAPPQEKSNLYLPILGKIVEMVHDSKTRKALMKAEDFSSFIKAIQGG